MTPGAGKLSIRLIKVFLALSVGVWGLIGLVGNLAGLPELYDTVRQVTSMANIPEGVGPPWRTSSPIIVIPGVIAIVLGKFAAVLCGVGGILMLRSISASADDFLRSKKLAVAGAGLAFALTFFSFTVVAETAFFSFFGPGGGAGALAFRYSASFALIALFIAQTETDQY